MKKKKKLNLSGPIAFAAAVLVLVVFIPLNLIFSSRDKVFDMTPSGKYTLSDKTVKLLDDTSDKQIDVFFLGKLKDLQDNRYAFSLSLYHTLMELDERSNITLKCFEPDDDPVLCKELDPSGVLGTDAGDTYIRCGNIVKKIALQKIFQTDSNGFTSYAGEELIAGAIQICTSGTLPTVYFLTGHGEYTIDDRYSTYADSIKANNYDVQSLDLSETKAIPANAKIIYLAGPQSDLTDEETDLLSAYLDNGGSVSFLLAPCETEGRFSNIEYLLEKFGISMDYNIVTESKSIYQLENREGEQNEYYFYVEYPEIANSDENVTTVDLTSELNTLISKGEYVNGISNTRSFALLPETSITNAANLERNAVIVNVADESSSYSTVSHAMGGDDITAANAENNLNGIGLAFGYYSLDKVSGGKMLVTGSTDIIDNDMISSSVSGSETLLLFSNTWLYDTDVQMGIGNKETAYDTISFTDSKHAESILGLIIIVPIVVALVGVIVWLRRRHA